jgi:2-polyprenyl-6-hydroxyphenyl methylase/3-demethylubiquinone-9 3-methyltransferase
VRQHAVWAGTEGVGRVRRRRDDSAGAPRRPVNDPAQYDDLAEGWWDPHGSFAALHWLATARARLVPRARHPGAVLLDVACGGGLLAPHVAPLGYRHVGVDIGREAVRLAAEHGVTAVRGDALALPVADGAADVVVAGEVFEHVPHTPRLVAEVCRVLAPGGLVVLDSIAGTAWGRFTAITVAERLPGGPPPRLHDPGLLVDRRLLVAEFARHGVRLRLWGLRPSLPGYLRWVLGRAEAVPLVRSRTTAGLFQGVGRTRTGPPREAASGPTAHPPP